MGDDRDGAEDVGMDNGQDESPWVTVKPNAKGRRRERDGKCVDALPSAVRTDVPTNVEVSHLMSLGSGGEVWRLAARKIFDDWTILRLAVQQSWGGRRSAAKRDLLVESVVNRIETKGTSCDAVSIADFLYEQVDRHFNTAIEDNSETELAELLLRLKSQCGQGDFTLAEKVFNQRASELQQSMGYEVEATQADTTDIDTAEIVSTATPIRAAEMASHTVDANGAGDEEDDDSEDEDSEYSDENKQV